MYSLDAQLREFELRFVKTMPQKRTLKRPQVNIVLTDPQLVDIQSIMEDRGILHLSDYVRQIITQDIRKWRAERYAEYTSAVQLKDSEFQNWLQWKQSQLSSPALRAEPLPHNAADSDPTAEEHSETVYGSMS